MDSHCAASPPHDPFNVTNGGPGPRTQTTYSLRGIFGASSPFSLSNCHEPVAQKKTTRSVPARNTRAVSVGLSGWFFSFCDSVMSMSMFSAGEFYDTFKLFDEDRDAW